MQKYKEMNLSAGYGVAVCEYPLPTGDSDYLLFIDGKPLGVIEAKKAGATLGGVEGQAGKYTKGVIKRLSI